MMSEGDGSKAIEPVISLCATERRRHSHSKVEKDNENRGGFWNSLMIFNI
jgi:hypothetical protein